MYSRRFNEQSVMPPPDYGGVTYLSKEEEQPVGEQNVRSTQRSTPTEEEMRANAVKKEQRNREERRIRRPIYRLPKERQSIRTQASEGERENEKGLLSGLFSLTGKKFSMEDIVLAGLILLMMSDREKENVDGEILLILGLLLLTK